VIDRADLVIRNALLRGRDGQVSVVVDAGRIAALSDTPVADADPPTAE